MTESRFNKILLVISFVILCFSLAMREGNHIRFDPGTIIKCEVSR